MRTSFPPTFVFMRSPSFIDVSFATLYHVIITLIITFLIMFQCNIIVDPSMFTKGSCNVRGAGKFETSRLKAAGLIVVYPPQALQNIKRTCPIKRYHIARLFCLASPAQWYRAYL